MNSWTAGKFAIPTLAILMLIEMSQAAVGAIAPLRPATTTSAVERMAEGVPSGGGRSAHSLVAISPFLRFSVGARPSRFRIGGFTRGGWGYAKPGTCTGYGDDLSITAVVPPLQADEVDPDQLTPEEQRTGELDPSRHRAVDQVASAQPTIFVHVPPIPLASAIQFTLQSEDGDDPVYEETFSLEQGGGIIGMQVPAAAALQLDTTYLWQAQVLCSPESPIGERGGPFTSSWLQRVSAETYDELATVEQLPLSDRPERYADAGIWQDTLASLAQLRYQNPEDGAIAAAWESLLTSVDLAALATAPILAIFPELAEDAPAPLPEVPGDR